MGTCEDTCASRGPFEWGTSRKPAGPCTARAVAKERPCLLLRCTRKAEPQRLTYNATHTVLHMQLGGVTFAACTRVSARPAAACLAPACRRLPAAVLRNSRRHLRVRRTLRRGAARRLAGPCTAHEFAEVRPCRTLPYTARAVTEARRPTYSATHSELRTQFRGVILPRSVALALHTQLRRHGAQRTMPPTLYCTRSSEE